MYNVLFYCGFYFWAFEHLFSIASLIDLRSMKAFSLRYRHDMWINKENTSSIKKKIIYISVYLLPVLRY